MTILFFHFDGTTNCPADAFAPATEDESVSNVLKSHLLMGGGLNEAGGQLQVSSDYRSFYYAGIGTYGSALERWLNTSFAFERADVADILNRALYDFQCHYHTGIRYVVLIGFSRGAALARRFASLIDSFVDRPMVIEVVMDTVASIGWPNLDKQKRPNCEVVFEQGGVLPKCVLRALHLLALDEQRLAFRPTLMNADSRVEEVWLPGVHSDVGGGYRHDALADLSFTVMKRWLCRVLGINKASVPLYYQVKSLPLLSDTQQSLKHWRSVLELTPSATGRLHKQKRLPSLSNITLAPRLCYVLRDNQPCFKTSPYWHRSVFERIQLQKGYHPKAINKASAVAWLES